ncbi:hypothetical protein EDD17DRAFT_1509217 [Pisolithus thermaeus]|nr:hypothetical protein EDD17DRAFT_1509217 [Pisolithus thermaeus]
MNCTSLAAQAGCVLPHSRERRLTERVQRNIPKRPHGSPVTPGPQVVSDTLQRTTLSNESNIEDRFQTHFQKLFDLPAPAECSVLDCPRNERSCLMDIQYLRLRSSTSSIGSSVMRSPPRYSETVVQDVQERYGDFRGFDDVFLRLGNEGL